MTLDWKGENLIQVTPAPHTARGVNLRSPAMRSNQPALSAEIVARRERVSGLIRRGQAMVSIAALLEIDYGIIYHDCKAMGLLPSSVRKGELEGGE